MVTPSLFTRLSSAILLNETVFNSDDLILQVLLLKRKEPYLKALGTKLKRSSYVQVTVI